MDVKRSIQGPKVLLYPEVIKQFYILFYVNTNEWLTQDDVAGGTNLAGIPAGGGVDQIDHTCLYA